MDGCKSRTLTLEQQQSQRKQQQQQQQMLLCCRHPGRKEETLAAHNKQQTTHMGTGKLEAQDWTGCDPFYPRPSGMPQLVPTWNADEWRLLPESGGSVGVVSCSYCAPPSGWILQERRLRSPRRPTAGLDKRS